MKVFAEFNRSNDRSSILIDVASIVAVEPAERDGTLIRYAVGAEPRSVEVLNNPADVRRQLTESFEYGEDAR